MLSAYVVGADSGGGIHEGASAGRIDKIAKKKLTDPKQIARVQKKG